MKATILEKILEAKRRRIADLRASVDLDTLVREALAARSGGRPHLFRQALERSERVNIIAEIKRASPSKGLIDEVADPAARAREYELGGACALSVLTEEDFFKGSVDDLKRARAAVTLPILRKDFVVDEFQIYEAAAAGADAILLIVGALEFDHLARLHDVAERVLGLDALVEVHDRAELEIARQLGCGLIGVNNRSLHTFGVSLDVSRELIALRPAESLMVAESGISSAEEIIELKGLGFNGFLVGESLMKSSDPKRLLEAWV